MTFKPPSKATTPGRTAIELWDGERQAATIYAGRAGLMVEFEPGYGAGNIEIDVRPGSGVLLPIKAA
jgi:hypothetical protein